MSQHLSEIIQAVSLAVGSDEATVTSIVREFIETSFNNGWKMVPHEATTLMVDCAQYAAANPHYDDRTKCLAVWLTMQITAPNILAENL